MGRTGRIDVGGSWAETIAHLRENGRITVVLCAFSGPPRILRLHGTGEVVTGTAAVRSGRSGAVQPVRVAWRPCGSSPRWLLIG